MSAPPNVVVYYRTRPADPEASSAAMVVQRDAVKAWTAEHQATVLAEFTELEEGQVGRPQLGHARSLCRRENALLLIARTLPIGRGSSFNASSFNHIQCQQLTNPLSVVVYLRTRSAEPDESAAALNSQREGVAAWLSYYGPTSVVAEYVEDDAAVPDRPLLQHAVRLCERLGSGTTLLIGTLVGLGAGLEMAKPEGTMPCKIAWTPARPIVQRVPPPDFDCPANAPDRISLLFEPAGDGLLAVYLCNLGPEPLWDVRVSSIGDTTHVPEGQDLSTSIGRQDLGTVAAGTCRFIDRYSLYWDADSVTSYRIYDLQPDGTTETFGAVIGSGGPSGRFLVLNRGRSANAEQSAST